MKTYVIMKKPKNVTDRDIIIITRTPEQYDEPEGSKTKKEEKIGEIGENERIFVSSDDILRTSKRTGDPIDPFFTRGRHKDLDVY